MPVELSKSLITDQITCQLVASNPGSLVSLRLASSQIRTNSFKSNDDHFQFISSFPRFSVSHFLISRSPFYNTPWLYRRVISCQYYAINHVPVPRCYAMQCTIKELRSHWLALNRQLTLHDRCCGTRCKVT